jgi:hypothetical protein
MAQEEEMTKSPGGDLAGEIAYVKALAEEGRNAPLVGGALYVLWGAVIALAAGLSYLRYSGAIELAVVGGVWFWLGAIAVGWVASVAIGRRSHAKPGSLTIGNKTATAAWFAIGVFMSLFWIAAAAFRGHLASKGIDANYVFGLMFPIAFGLYGVAFYTTAVAARLDWMRGFAVAAWVFAIASFYFVGDLKQLLIGAAGSLICASLPGIILMRREPSEIV